jgi:peptidyl-prolyl cis-trans isomerase A (cyclophilin A)
MIPPDRVINGRKFFNDEKGIGGIVERGCIAMANYGPNTNGSQFYVSLGGDVNPTKTPFGGSVVFGKVVSGFDVLNKVNNLAEDMYGRIKPTKSVQLEVIGILNR